jgi:hypothetical protein
MQRKLARYLTAAVIATDDQRIYDAAPSEPPSP